ncbi:MAG: hypothetical protein ABGZ17_23665 [Planctomycetaceae bacterium]
MSNRIFAVLATAILVSTVSADNDDAQPKRVEDRDKKSTDFELTVRKDNGAYGTAAYSFRFATQHLRVHRNQVDLVYNRCGQLHVNAHGGMRSRITDLGQVDFNDQHKPPQQGWSQHSMRPTKGHVYLQEINDGQQRTYVKFLISDMQRTGTIKVKWSPLALRGKLPEFRRGGAGTMGQCGGPHQQR